MTPAGATEIMEIIGKDETIKRVKAAIEDVYKRQVITCVKELQEGLIHQTVGYKVPDEQCDLDYVRCV